MKRIWMIGSIAASLFVITVVGLAIFGVHQQANTKVQVVAAENVWGDIIRQIGGDKVTVTSIISNPNDDPHLYES
ncbi:MAG TPA: zinc ABC transporter substrate-binding protein, partial [Candidatus Saccharimonadales bacterium]|nr:zinc ABC transporter substrate-binding protein [Candidatus Saccharimonadales bacterium]